VAVYHRPTEGNPIGGENAGVAATYKMTETKRQRGRPKGSKNKPVSLVPAELADALLVQLKSTLPPEHYDYIRSAIKDGKAISTKHEAQVMLLILGRNLLPALFEEMKGVEDPLSKIDPDVAKEFGVDPETLKPSKKIEFRRDVNERLKVWAQILNIVAQMEKRDDDGSDTRTKPIFELVAKRGIIGERLSVLIGIQSGDLGGGFVPDRGEAARARAVSGIVVERPLSDEDSGQVETGGLLNSGLDRDLPRGDDPEELQGEYSFYRGEGS